MIRRKSQRTRSYERSHPWIKFDFSLHEAAPDFWLLLGEATSKVEHLAGVPLTPDVAQKLLSIYLAKGAAATTAIEGNTLSESEVLRRIRGQLPLPPSQEYLGQEIDNIVVAYNEISRRVVSPKGNSALTVELLQHYNKLVRKDLREDPDLSPPGELRTRSVIVGNIYRRASAEDGYFLLEALCEWLQSDDFLSPSEVFKVPFAIIKAIIAHLYIAWIHPFDDGNGRSARLLEFHLMLEAGVPVPAAHLLSDHYNRTRAEYYRQLDHASRSGGDVKPFIRYAVQGFLDGLRTQIALVREQQLLVSWEHYVHEQFTGLRPSESTKRQRDLVLQLGEVGDFVEISRIRDLSTNLARLYATKQARTVNRDLQIIEEMGLIERRYGKVRTKKELILAFLPACWGEAKN